MTPTKTALLFSGQGSQYAEMGKELVDKFTEAKKIFDLGSEIIGFNFHEKINNNELESTLIAQPAIFAVSIAALSAAKQAGISYSAVAGHSLGEYAALYAAGVFTLEDAFRILKIRSEIMSRIGSRHPTGGMAAVLGLKADVVEAVCVEIEDVEPVNYNSPVQTVIAGSNEALAEAETALSAKGAKRFMRINVSAAFHSKHMKAAAEEFKTKIINFTFNKPEIPFYSNLTGKLQDIITPDYLAKHMCSAVRFTEELFTMEKDGFNVYLELGPGKILSGLVKKTLESVKVCNIEDLKSLEAAMEALL